MKVRITVQSAGYVWDGTIQSWAPGTVLELADSDRKAVAWAHRMVDAGNADLIEDVKQDKRPARQPEASPGLEKATPHISPPKPRQP